MILWSASALQSGWTYCTLTPSTDKGVWAGGAWKRRAVNYCRTGGNTIYDDTENMALLSDIEVQSSDTRYYFRRAFSNTFAALPFSSWSIFGNTSRNAGFIDFRTGP